MAAAIGPTAYAPITTVEHPLNNPSYRPMADRRHDLGNGRNHDGGRYSARSSNAYGRGRQ